MSTEMSVGSDRTSTVIPIGLLSISILISTNRLGGVEDELLEL